MEIEVVTRPRKASRRPQKPRSGSKKPKTRKSLHKTKKDLWAEFGLQRPPKPRYAGLRGILWYVLSQYVRARDLKLWGNICVNCGKEKEDFHGGHFIATGDCGWDGLALDEKNIHAECSFCNFRDKAKLNYARNLDIRYGKGTAQKLRDRYYKYKHSGVVHKNWNNEYYRFKIKHYQQLLLDK